MHSGFCQNKRFIRLKCTCDLYIDSIRAESLKGRKLRLLQGKKVVFLSAKGYFFDEFTTYHHRQNEKMALHFQLSVDLFAILHVNLFNKRKILLFLSS